MLITVQADLMPCVCYVVHHVGVVFDHPADDEEDCLRFVPCQLIENEPCTPAHVERHLVRHPVAAFEVKAHQKSAAVLYVSHVVTSRPQASHRLFTRSYEPR